MTKKDFSLIIQKLDQMDEEFDGRLDTIEKVLIIQEENLRTHMKRSDSLEKMIDSIRSTDIPPLKKHILMVEGVMKFLGLLSLLVGSAVGVISIFSSFF